MCGIAGIFVRDDRTPERAAAQRMIDAIAHRGPDRRAVHTEPHVALSAARLSVVDLSPAAGQPFTDSSGDRTIVFNGEIFNFKEIRTELETLGHHFLSHSDTEVVLHAFRQWGEECQRRFNGMWAFAIWDRKARRLFLSRDRFGIKPLYVAQFEGQFLFASEIKAILAAGVPAALASDAFNNYCGGESMFEGIEPVPAGSFLVCTTDSAPSTRRWWNTVENLVTAPKRFADRVEAFRELLMDSVRLRLRVDVTPAVTLSGGLDSSSVYACAQELRRKGLARTATEEQPVVVTAWMGAFPGNPLDESVFALRVARYFGQEVQSIEIHPDRFRELVEEMTWHQEGLVWNASVMVHHEFYRQLAARGVRVVLEGHGSDELLAGYMPFAQDQLHNHIRALRLPSAWSAARALARTKNRLHGQAGQSAVYLMASAAFRAVFPRHAPPAHRHGRTIVDRDLLTRFSPPPRFAADIPGLSPLKQAIYGGFHSRLLPTGLRANDRETMASGIESRAPFLDHRLVSFVFSIPDDDIIGRGWTKRILREAMRPFLPADILWRQAKGGFVPPQPEWFGRPGVIAALEGAVADGTIARAPGIDRRKFEEALSRGKVTGFGWPDSTELWTAYTYAIWNDLFVTRGRTGATNSAAANA